jgi:transposase
MHQINQLLEHLSRGFSVSKISKLLNMSRNTIRDFRRRFEATGMSYLSLLALSMEELAALIKNTAVSSEVPSDPRHAEITALLPHFQSELKKTGVTRFLLWQEYLHAHPNGYRYTKFCDLLNRYIQKNDAVMHQFHLPGQELQVDFAGKKLSCVDIETGEVLECEVLIATMAYSHYTFAIALRSQKQDDFIYGLVKALDYLGAVPQIIRTDNLKSAVKKADRYTPEFTEAMEYFAEYYGTTAMATRVRKPRDKASVESAVNICYTRIYAPLRHQIFHSLQEINHAIKQQLTLHNQHLLQGKSYCRAERYIKEEKPLMKPLPPQAYQLKRSTWSKAGKNYHVILGEDRHSYSVPYRFIGEKMKLIYTADLVEIYHGQQRIAVHIRNYKKNDFSTIPEHMPTNHQHILKMKLYDGSDFLREAAHIGPFAEQVVNQMIRQAKYIQHTYTLWMAFKRLNKTYGSSRLENACKRIAGLPYVSCKNLNNILKAGLDFQPTFFDIIPKENNNSYHQNIRGREAFE